MNSRLLFIFGFISLFFISLFLFYFYIRPDKFTGTAFIQSIAISLPPVIYLIFRRKAKNLIINTRGVYTMFSPLVAFLVAVVVIFSLLSIDLDSLQLTRDVRRESNVYIRLIALHVVLFLFLCIYTYSSDKYKRIKFILIALSFTLSLSIALLEGRRTSILIPIILLGLFSITSAKSKKEFKFKVLLFAGLFVGLFLAITAIRTPNIVQLDILFRAILSRLFNPGHMLLEVMTTNDFSFEPHTLSQIVDRIGYVFGMNSYKTTTNEFGVYYGFLRSSNSTVGINPGVVTELFLSFGWFYMIGLIIIFEFSFFIMEIYRRLLFNADLFIAVLILHGMQMEVPYTVGLLIKLAFFGLILYGLAYILPKKKL